MPVVTGNITVHRAGGCSITATISAWYSSSLIFFNRISSWLTMTPQHLNSRTHRGADVSCPFCKRAFTSASGVSHYLESGSCPNEPRANRESMFRALRQRDRNGIITNNLLEWHEGTWSTKDTWNGHTYQCYLCRRGFAAVGDLDSHLKSPAHMQEIYHCPNKVRCGSQFKSLAGMFNHLESESCGFIKFAGVQSNVGGILAGKQRLIGFS